MFTRGRRSRSRGRCIASWSVAAESSFDSWIMSVVGTNGGGKAIEDFDGLSGGSWASIVSFFTDSFGIQTRIIDQCGAWTQFDISTNSLVAFEGFVGVVATALVTASGGGVFSRIASFLSGTSVLVRVSVTLFTRLANCVLGNSFSGVTNQIGGIIAIVLRTTGSVGIVLTIESTCFIVSTRVLWLDSLFGILFIGTLGTVHASKSGSETEESWGTLTRNDISTILGLETSNSWNDSSVGFVTTVSSATLTIVQLLHFLASCLISASGVCLVIKIVLYTLG